ncbi:MAG: hypothetical protein COT74_13595 [Bdellovibrionales bacterium CG10_big_fil_rev_8_21_14_0_10_45_34]|nr:MAG: hypothetical protein COT74_13595 [Bdellovibrionales bacterium CG10_big_fil_rev_8_21_14_0_10_45_34]
MGLVSTGILSLFLICVAAWLFELPHFSRFCGDNFRIPIEGLLLDFESAYSYFVEHAKIR